MPPKHEGGKEEMGVKKKKSVERNGRARKSLFMRGETKAESWGRRRRRGKDNGRRKVA